MDSKAGAIALMQGGEVINGNTADTTASILGPGGGGVAIGGTVSDLVLNYGTITSKSAGNAVVLTPGGTVVNGALSDGSRPWTGGIRALSWAV